MFARKQRERRYRAVFIDFGYCFHAGEWKFEDAPLRGVYYRNDVYREITGWESFEPWLTRLETMPAETVWAAANEVPPEWYGGDLGEMEALVEKLLARRSRIRELIEAFGNSDRKPFPNWGIAPRIKPAGKPVGRTRADGNDSIAGKSACRRQSQASKDEERKPATAMRVPTAPVCSGRGAE